MTAIASSIAHQILGVSSYHAFSHTEAGRSCLGKIPPDAPGHDSRAVRQGSRCHVQHDQPVGERAPPSATFPAETPRRSQSEGNGTATTRPSHPVFTGGGQVNTKFFTNDQANTLLNKFAGIFAHNPDIEFFDALVGYLRASGYFALRPHLDHVPKIRILVGIDVDAFLVRQHRKGLLHLADADKTLAEIRAALRQDIQSAPYQQEVEAGILQFVKDVASRRIEIRAHPTKRLHAKIYVFRPKGFCEHKPGAVITGSSNLTAAGLGTEDASRNYEFNVLLHDYRDVKFAADEFQRLWDEGLQPKMIPVGEVLLSLKHQKI